MATDAAFVRALIEGLSARPRRLSPKWFYDAAGSALFDRICGLPEYYPTRTEMALLDRHAPEFAARIGPGAEIVEFGAGSSRKLRVLLGALSSPAAYLPVDISGDHLMQEAAALQADHPRLDVRPQVGDFTAPDFELPPPEGRRVGFFPGSSIGNFEPAEAEALLRRFAGWLRGGALLIGVDLVKTPALLHAAYNDAQDVTAAFNKNLWARANREAGADFDLSAWAHYAFYNAPLQRIEMHLVSLRAQTVHVAGRSFDIAEGDSVHTENSCKYTLAGFRDLAARAGFDTLQTWTDAQRRFSLHWLTPKEITR